MLAPCLYSSRAVWVERRQIECFDAWPVETTAIDRCACTAGGQEGPFGCHIPGFVLAGKHNRPLKSFLRKEALPYEDHSLARTWVAVMEGSADLLGFITIVSGEVSVVRTGAAEDAGTKKFRYHFIQPSR